MQEIDVRHLGTLIELPVSGSFTGRLVALLLESGHLVVPLLVQIVQLLAEVVQ